MQSRLRFTVRGMMVAVAVSAAFFSALLAVVRTSQLVQDYRGSAQFSAEAERYNLQYAATCDQKAAEARERGEPALAEKYEKEAEVARFWAPEHRLLAQTFERAASHPWEPLPPGVQVFYRRPPMTATEALARWLTGRGLTILIVVLVCITCLAVILIRNLPRRAVTVSS
jgi:hypothetical protein